MKPPEEGSLAPNPWFKREFQGGHDRRSRARLLYLLRSGQSRSKL